MSFVHIMVVGEDSTLASFLASHLTRPDVRVIGTTPGNTFLENLMVSSPDIAVLDEIDQRPLAAQKEVAILRQRYPRAVIIAVSGHSTAVDGTIVEQGIYYYLAPRSRRRLLRVVEAALHKLDVTSVAASE